MITHTEYADMVKIFEILSHKSEEHTNPTKSTPQLLVTLLKKESRQ